MKHLIVLLSIVFYAFSSKGQDLNKKLHNAVIEKDTASVKFLLEQGANANYKPKVGFFEMSLLIWAAQNNDLADVKLLVEHNAEVDFRDAFKTTALMYAASKGSKDIVTYLISKGADVTAKDGQGNSVLSAAKESKNKELITIIEALLKNDSR